MASSPVSVGVKLRRHQLENEGKFDGETGTGVSGRAFLGDQLTKAGQMLGDLWYSAWEQAPIDTYLQTQLLKRKNGNEPGAHHSSIGVSKSKSEN